MYQNGVSDLLFILAESHKFHKYISHILRNRSIGARWKFGQKFLNISAATFSILAHDFLSCFFIKNLFKETVSQDGRGYKSGINWKVSLNPIISDAKKLFSWRAWSQFTIKSFSAVPKHLIWNNLVHSKLRCFYS